jgi:hypothetical protein
MDANLFEILLRESEGQCYDFKRDQYLLDNDVLKGEFVKDILAFANSWRMSDAYILIGVNENKRVGGRCTVVGISNHHDDATLQQIVNGSTNKPVAFHYSAFHYQGKEIGIIRIPKQPRAFCLRKALGKLAPNIVYYRQGSSTATALPDEIASMVSSDSSAPTPVIKLSFLDTKTNKLIDDQYDLKVSDRKLLKKYPTYSSGEIMDRGNAAYWQNLAIHLYFRDVAGSIKIEAKNESCQLAQNVRVELSVSENAKLIDPDNIPDLPSKSMYGYVANVKFERKDAEINFRKRGKIELLEFHMGSIQPKAIVETMKYSS